MVEFPFDSFEKLYLNLLRVIKSNPLEFKARLISHNPSPNLECDVYPYLSYFFISISL